MTFEQFVSSNRDTNAGDPLPVPFMKQLYNSIKESEIELRGSVGGEMQALETGKLQWANLVAARSESIASASFTPSHLSSQGATLYPAGVHERDMFTCIASGCFKALVKVLQTSSDDFLVLKALQGIYRYATISAYYKMGERLNQALVALLEVTSSWLKGEGRSIREFTVDIPRACFLRDLARRKEVAYPWAAGEGAAQHMGTVSLHTALEIMADYGSLMTRGSWDGFIEMLCVLLDREALPTALVHLDDMIDMRGNQLKPSHHSRPPQFRSSQRKWIENDLSADGSSSSDANQSGILSSFTSIFWTPAQGIDSDTQGDNRVAGTHGLSQAEGELSSFNDTGQSDSDRARSSTLAMSSMLKMVLDVEALFSPVRPANEVRWARALPDESLVDLVKSLTDRRRDNVLQSMISLQRKHSDSTNTPHSTGGFWNRSAVAAASLEVVEAERRSEGRTVFKLELTARVLAANVNRLHLIFPSFFKLFSSLVTSPKIATHMPFLLERAVIVILRLWPLLAHTVSSTDKQSHQVGVDFATCLELLLSIPSEFTTGVSDRIAYGISTLFATTSKSASSVGTTTGWPRDAEVQWSVALKLLLKCLNTPVGRPAVVDAMTVCLHMEKAHNVPLLIHTSNLNDIQDILLELSSVEVWVNQYGSCSAGPKNSSQSDGVLPPTRDMLSCCATSIGLLAQLVDMLRRNKETYMTVCEGSGRGMHKSSSSGQSSSHDNLLPPTTTELPLLLDNEEEEECGRRDQLLLDNGPAVTDEALFICWKRALIQLCKATELAHFTTVKAACEAIQRILSQADQIITPVLGQDQEGGDRGVGGVGFSDLEEVWGWVFGEVLFKQGPLLRVLQTSSLRPMDTHCESRAIQCIGVLSSVLLHHMNTLLASAPTLFEGTVLKLARLDAIIFKYTRSEAAAESLMNLLTVVQCEIRGKEGFKSLMSRAREIVDSLCPALTDELHARAPGLHPSSLHRMMELQMQATQSTPTTPTKEACSTPSKTLSISPALERKDTGSASFTV